MGLMLGAEDFTLEVTWQSHKGNPVDCCREMLENWLKGKQNCGTCSRTWDAFLPVVESVVGSDASAFIKKNILNWEEEEPVEHRPAESEFCSYMLCVVMDLGQLAVCDIS